MILNFLTSINLSKVCIGSSECTEQLQINMHIFANLGKRFGYRNLIIWSTQTLATPVWLQPKTSTTRLSELLVCLLFGGQILRQKSYFWLRTHGSKSTKSPLLRSTQNQSFFSWVARPCLLALKEQQCSAEMDESAPTLNFKSIQVSITTSNLCKDKRKSCHLSVAT